MRIEDVPEKNKHGNCFEVALHTFMEDMVNRTLVHGIVTGQGPIKGIKYNHAWVEENGVVVDNTVHITLPCEVYYSLGQIEITRKYDRLNVNKMIEKFGTYGPWDKELMRYP